MRYGKMVRASARHRVCLMISLAQTKISDAFNYDMPLKEEFHAEYAPAWNRGLFEEEFPRKNHFHFFALGCLCCSARRTDTSSSLDDS